MVEKIPSKNMLDSSDSDIIEQKREELALITQFLQEFSIRSFSFLKFGPWEDGFFIKLLANSSCTSQCVFDYWKNAQLLEPISPIWKVYLSTNAFKYIISEEKKEIFFYYLIDLMKGRFKIKEKNDYYFLVVPLYSENKNLFALLIEDLENKPGLSILVRKVGKDDCTLNYNKIEKLSTLFSDKILLKKNEIYFPGDEYFKNKTEEKIYIESYFKIKPLPELKLTNNLEKIKHNFEKYRKAYLSVFGANNNEFTNWTNLVFHTLYKQRSSQFLFKILPNFSTSWCVLIEMKILQVFKNIKENEFLHYLNKISEFTQCLAIEDFELFYKLNELPNDDFLILPLIFKDTGLKTIFSVLCIGKSQLTDKYEYQLKLVDFLDLNSYEEQIEKFRNTNKYIKINKICERPGIKSFFIIKKNQKVVPILELSLIKPLTNSKKILFLCNLKKKYYKFELLECIESEIDSNGFLKNSSNKKKLEITENLNELNAYKDNLTTYLVEIDTLSLEGKNFFISLEMSNILHYSYKDKTKRVLQNLEYLFLFDVNFLGKNEKSGSIKNFDDIYLQLQIYLNYYLQIRDFKSLEYLVYSFSNLNYEMLLRFENSLFEQSNIINLIELITVDFISLDDANIFYILLSILGLIKLFPSKNVEISDRNFDAIFFGFENYKSDYIKLFKVKLNYNPVFKGIAKILAYRRIKNNSVKVYFDAIFDYEILYTVLYTYMDALKLNKIFIDTEEMNNIIEYSINFPIEKKILILEKILGLLNRPEQIIQIFLSKHLVHKSIVDKKRFFLDALNSSSLDNKGLLDFLEFLTSNNVYEKNLFTSEDILNFINIHFNVRKKVSLYDFPVIKSILKVIQDELHLQGFKIYNFLKEQVLNYGFHQCIDLLLVNQTLIPRIFDKWIMKKMSKNNLKIDIILIEKELQTIPEFLRQTTSLRAIHRLHKYYSLTSTESFGQSESPILLEAAKAFLSKVSG